jgi:phage gp16-like protein
VRVVLSSSSIAFSSIESEFVDRLPRRRMAEVLGEVPERPSVVTESLRRWSLAAEEASGVEKGAAVGCETELFRKRLVKALEVIEPRRCRAMSFALVVGFPLSEDMAKKWM